MWDHNVYDGESTWIHHYINSGPMLVHHYEVMDGFQILHNSIDVTDGIFFGWILIFTHTHIYI